MSHGFVPSPWSLIRNVLGSCFFLRETNSPRPGSNLWGPCESLAPPRRRAQRRTCYGRNSLWKSHSLASRRRWARETPHPRALRFPAKKTPRKRRHHADRISHQPETPPLETAQEIHTETPNFQEAYS